MVHVTIDRREIEAFCLRWQISELALFGSVLREDFRADSDVDVLVTFSPEARHGLLDLSRMEDELSGILGRKADLVERAALEQSRNYIRRAAVLGSMETIYAA